jgi:hypothetical protein
MSAVRQWSGIGVAAASAYGIALLLYGRPEFERYATLESRLLLTQATQLAHGMESLAQQSLWAFERKPADELAASVEKDILPAGAPPSGPVTPSRSAVEIDLVLDGNAHPLAPPQGHPFTGRFPHGGSLRVAPSNDEFVAATSEANGLLRLIPPSKAAAKRLARVPGRELPGSDELARVERRLRDNLSAELYDNFKLFLYVSKAPVGPWAQRMYVFRKLPRGDLALLHDWAVSTGRERVEYNTAGMRLPSYTPSGYYELDPARFYRHHVSAQWDQPMPYAMFFNWLHDGHPTGLAIHGATGPDIDMLGKRASAGCVRLAPEAARTLFTLIRTQYRGLAPRFAIDRLTGTMSNDGIVLHDARGRVQLAEGYKVLVFIEDYGGENVVAAMF